MLMPFVETVVTVGIVTVMLLGRVVVGKTVLERLMVALDVKKMVDGSNEVNVVVIVLVLVASIEMIPAIPGIGMVRVLTREPTDTDTDTP